MPDHTPPTICRRTVRLPRPAVPDTRDWRQRTVEAVLRQSLLTVHRQRDDRLVTTALARLFVSPSSRAPLSPPDDDTLRDLATTLRACLDPTAASTHWSRATTIVQKLLLADG